MLLVARAFERLAANQAASCRSICGQQLRFASSSAPWSAKEPSSRSDPRSKAAKKAQWQRNSKVGAPSHLDCLQFNTAADSPFPLRARRAPPSSTHSPSTHQPEQAVMVVSLSPAPSTCLTGPPQEATVGLGDRSTFAPSRSFDPSLECLLA